MTYKQAEWVLLHHLMECGFMMPIAWVEKNGEGSEFQTAYKMALDLIREKEKQEDGD